MRLTGILRRVPLFARDTGRHTGQFLDMQWARFLGEKPAYTAPATQVVTLPCHQPDPRWQLHTPAAVPLEFLEIHHPGNVPAAAHPAPAEAATPARQRPQAPSLPFTGARVPDTPNLDQGLWHLRPQQWQDDTGSFKAICEVAA